MTIIIAIACTLSAYASIIHAASSSGRDEMTQNTQEAAVDEAGEYRASLSADLPAFECRSKWAPKRMCD
jgi:hypothetical protein